MGNYATSLDSDYSRRPRARQRSSHSRLFRDLSARPPRSGRIKPLDAIIVPAGRKAERLRPVAKLAALADIRLVVMASRDCYIADASEVVASIPGCRALIIGIPADYENKLLSFRTSESFFASLQAGRNSDLSLKRNLGLLLARLMRWEKVMFLDDDIFGVTPTTLAKVAAQLDYHQVTGLISPDFPDNSVVCHANRLGGHQQGNFVTGAALGVNCDERPLDFFPDVYNEDWFFFATHAAQGRVISVGEARQQLYKPFADGERAAMEEFGDLVAEGLYALFSDGYSLDAASESYWDEFRTARYNLITGIADDVDHLSTHEAVQASSSMERAKEQIEGISAKDCEDFVAAWRYDRGVFAKTARDMPGITDCATACEYLNLTDWREAEFGLRDEPRARPAGALQPVRSETAASQPVSLAGDPTG